MTIKNGKQTDILDHMFEICHLNTQEEQIYRMAKGLTTGHEMDWQEIGAKLNMEPAKVAQIATRAKRKIYKYLIMRK